MSKSDTPLRRINTQAKARQTINEPTFAAGKPINGLDTETADGDIFMVGCHYDSGRYQQAGEPDEPLRGYEALEFLTQKSMKGAINVWYNLSFDANVLLKGLPMKKLKELRMHNSTSFESPFSEREWEVTYIPKKMLELRASNNHVYRHYDVSQFCYTSLDNAAKEWLNEDVGKFNENIDVTKFGQTDGGKLNDYIVQNWDEISRYMERDCELTREIFAEIAELAENDIEPAIPFGQPYSTGYVAADYTKNRFDHKPGYGNVFMQELAWDSYGGGRFEVYKRGAVGEVYGADINSAYPAIMSELPDPSSLEWTPKATGASLDELRDADYGFIEVTVTTDASRPIQPFMAKNEDAGGRVEYPAMEGVEITTLIDTFLFALDAGYIEDYEIHCAALGNEHEGTNYPFDFFKSLYSDRKTLEDEGFGKKAKLLKIVMNSMYGKTCQTNINYEEIGEEKSYEDALAQVEAVDGDEIVTDAEGQPFIEKVIAGSMFNPFIAAYTTGKTRLQLHESVVENGLEDATVMLATDCIMVEKEPFEASDLYDLCEYEPDDYADALGGWDYDYVGDAFVIGSGVYEVDTGDGLKKSVRGFRELMAADEPLRKKAANNPDGIPVESTRPTTIGDVLHTGGKLSDVGVFRDAVRTLTPDMDGKRRWNCDSPDFADLLEGAEGSKPKLLE